MTSSTAEKTGSKLGPMTQLNLPFALTLPATTEKSRQGTWNRFFGETTEDELDRFFTGFFLSMS